ncbi:amidohydrolase family protein [Actinoplanes bogorensis]|uniref:Amidohydrolase family protein n=1 Tax=Paractinoplanes bogorensis TaxID=1610840 RepID=A0ABS5YGM8_9ACTN|nr:amidohydrolase family protein [Actinoplanes bogorensis]MBU2662537.1 amidohydrolase family protein [Actinoplanes bogorensis]
MSRILIRGGHVLSMDPAVGDHPAGDVLIEDGVITSVGPALHDVDAEIVDAAGMVVMPGLIDTHRHTWQGAFGQVAADWTLNEYFAGIIGRLSPRFTPDDVRAGTHFGALEALDTGVTTLFDWAHIMNTPDHADASIDALRAAGIRSVFGHGPPTSDPSWYYASDRRHPDDIRRIAAQAGGLLTVAMAARGPELSTIDATADDLRLARELGLRTSMHVGVGLLGAQRSISQLHERGLLGPDLIFLHASTSTDDELRMLADAGSSASVSPRVEMMMGHGFPATGRLLAAGVRPALSVDVTAGVPGDLFGEMRAAIEAERLRRYDQLLQRGEQPDAVPLTTRQAVEFATIDGARSLGLDDRIGSLTPGKQADVILIRTGRVRDAAAAVAFAAAGDVDTVLVGGEFRKRHGVSAGIRAAAQRAEESRERIELAGPADEETATWNQALSHHPYVTVGATSVADVQAAVRFAARYDKSVAVLATGHGALTSADGSVLINVRRMDQITIDARARTATVGAGVEMQSLIDAAAKEGLAPIAGSSPNVGVVGFTLGGGLSPFLGRAHGFASDHVRRAEIVTPDGEVRQIDADTEPDLFWAIRGGKGNFGVVTSLTVDLLPITRLYGGGLFYPGEHAAAVVEAYRALIAEAPEELTASIAFLRLPPAPFVPEPLRARFTVHVRIAYLGTAEDGARLITPLREVAPLLIDSVDEMPFSAVAAIHADPVDPLPAYEVSAELADFPAEAAEALLAVAGPESGTEVLMVEIRQLGGALAREPRVPSAVEHRTGGFQMFVAAVGAPGMAEDFRPALRTVSDALAPWATGKTQINFLSAYDVTTADITKAYGETGFDRLRHVKTKWDPRNLFRINHNIPPYA